MDTNCCRPSGVVSTNHRLDIVAGLCCCITFSSICVCVVSIVLDTDVDGVDKGLTVKVRL